jgi:murein DD-endopeptidase MepM/ murein hydrolase activator NlpD
MAFRAPVASPFANTDSSLALVIGRGAAPKIIQLRPWAAVAGTAIAVLLMAWYLVATLYIVFKDDILSRLLTQQTEMQYAYEDRLAALRNQIDKVTSLQVIDQNSLEGKVHELISRQSQLETRHALLQSLTSQPSLAAAPTPLPQRRPASVEITGSIPARASAFAPVEPTPLPNDILEIRNPQPGKARAMGGPDSRDFAPVDPTALRSRKHSRVELPGSAAVVAVRSTQSQIEKIEAQQLAALDIMDRSARERARRWSAAFEETGLSAERFLPIVNPKGARPAAQGGPLIPLNGRTTDEFHKKLVQVQLTLKQADKMRRVMDILPTHRPLPEQFETSSTFGPRSDPFTGQSALHSGIDFRAPTGTPVRAAAHGAITEAQTMGGYGRMVEIEHGAGLTTRYAHLSTIAVTNGQKVRKGDIVGYVGSTGRSTGPHLHYETRVDDAPMDPARFLRAARRLGVADRF